MRTFIIMAFTIFCQNAFCQSDTLTHYFKEIGWTIKAPSSFIVIDSITSIANLQKGKNLIGNSSQTKIDLSKSKELISMHKGKGSFFVSSISRSASITKDNWLITDKSNKEMLFDAFLKMPKAKFDIDSVSSIQTIDGLEFKKIKATCLFNENRIVHIFYLSQFYKDYYLGIFYFYIENESGEEIETMLNNSRFDK